MINHIFLVHNRTDDENNDLYYRLTITIRRKDVRLYSYRNRLNNIISHTIYIANSTFQL